MHADLLGRPLRNLRLSVTDRCNLRCEYCMPEDEYNWLPREDVLHFEEISALVDVFLAEGVDGRSSPHEGGACAGVRRGQALRDAFRCPCDGLTLFREVTL